MIDLLKLAREAALQAGVEILKIYNSDNLNITFKEDESPLTQADQNAHNVIVEKLINTGIPVLSEEDKEVSFIERKTWMRYWLIDPLDGTKEFINQNGEFTVNIALIEKGTPILGVVYCPVKKWLYFGDEQNGSFKMDLNMQPELAQRLPIFMNRESLVVVASKSHLNDETVKFIENLKSESSKQVEFISMGSSLKLCLVAEGMADYYPRLAPTMEWDTAAAHAVVKYSGGKVLNFDTQEELEYNKENLLNPSFIVQRY